MITNITLFQGITLAIALLGAILGVINTWQTLDKSRVKLLVIPKHATQIGVPDSKLTFCVEVINMSAFAVTVDEVGVFFKGTEIRGCIRMPILIDGGTWPRRLEPRSAVTLYGQKPESTSGNRIKCAYAMTSCGHTQTGITPALKQIARNEL
ncbi:hypothetical protein H8L32_06495 [Undibacterium sp. CY18W]|uniref:Uncharacterized protein n=1 Tax=Undibacterium hunanense TaxID=2762292 RepID=A0ABR6ZMJ9_9BURK|nr:hypothetical protein [Undibacterium hunanense]MBC3917118.1 hypothetical protein [Undibacterium hunanense]